eukprot:6468939-Amphidinium_carterae.1
MRRKRKDSVHAFSRNQKTTRTPIVYCLLHAANLSAHAFDSLALESGSNLPWWHVAHGVAKPLLQPVSQQVPMKAEHIH